MDAETMPDLPNGSTASLIDRVFGGLVRGRTAIRHHASGRAAVGAFVRRTLAGLSFLAAWLRRERSLWGNDGRNR